MKTLGREKMIRRIVLVGFQFFFSPVRIDLHLQLQLQVHKKTFFTTQNTPDFDPSSLATISTWEAETWYALLCRIDLEPQKFSARTDPIYEIRMVLLGIQTVHVSPSIQGNQDSLGLSVGNPHGAFCVRNAFR